MCPVKQATANTKMTNNSIYDPNFLAPIIRYADEVGNWLNPTPEVSQNLQTITRNSDEFLDFVIGLYGNIKPIFKNKVFSPTDTLLPSNVNNITYRDAEWSAIPFLQFLRSVPWSHFNVKKQTVSTYNSGVPLLLHAMRVYHDIPYSAWQNEPGNRKYYVTILGNGYKQASVAFADDDPRVFTKEEILEFREGMVTGTKSGKPHKFAYTDHKYNKVGDNEWDGLPKVYKMMLAQVWIFNGQCRNDKMILDWVNWDNIPEPFDTIQATFSKNKDIKKTPVDWGVLF